MDKRNATESKAEKVSSNRIERGCYGVQKGKRVWNRIKKSMSTDLKQEKYLGTV